MEEIVTGFLASTIRLAAPLVFACIGEIIVERSGALNAGVEGVMLMGAFVGWAVVFLTGNLWLGVILAMISGVLMGLSLAILIVNLRTHVILAGLSLFFLGWGLSSFFSRVLLKITPDVSPMIEGFGPVNIPLLSEIPILGPALFQQNVLVYLAIILLPLMYIFLFKTTFGLKIRAVGENPRAADTLGINVYRIRYISILIGTMLAGLSGAFLSLAYIYIFQDYMTGGIGFIVIALVFFGNWGFGKTFVGCLLFSSLQTFQLRAQIMGFAAPVQLLAMIPYIFIVVSLPLIIRHAKFPKALAQPYER